VAWRCVQEETKKVVAMAHTSVVDVGKQKPAAQAKTQVLPGGTMLVPVPPVPFASMELPTMLSRGVSEVRLVLWQY
jgi:hypothetical protein